MDNIHQLTHAYSQAPWRKQMYMIGVILLLLVCAAIVAGIYLNVTARAAAVGRQIQEMQVRVYGYHYLTGDTGETYVPIEELEQKIANLNSQLAYLTSYTVMQERVKELNLTPIACRTYRIYGSARICRKANHFTWRHRLCQWW